MNNRIIILLISLAGLFSCTVYKEYPIDVYKAGAVPLPSDASKIAILSRNFKFANDTLQHYFIVDGRLVKDRKNANKNIDSLAVSKAMQGLATELRNNGNFSNISLFPYNLIKPHRGTRMSAFNWEFVHKLTDPAKVDILISLETLSYFYSTYGAASTGNSGYDQVITAASWGVYDPAAKKIIDHKQSIDTIYWDASDQLRQGNNNQLPDRLSAIELACELAGENYAKRLTHSWQNVSRMYIIPPVEDFRIASQFFEDGKWDDAIKMWENYTPEKFGKLAIDARYNTALGYEMKDDFVNATTWITKAEDLARSLKSREDLKMILRYKKILDARQTEVNKLND